MDTYDNGKPKRFASEIQILTKKGKRSTSGRFDTSKNIETTIDVNKPYEVDGWKIYQYGYDTTTFIRHSSLVIRHQPIVWPFGCSSVPSSSCKCVGGASTTYPLPKVQAYTPIASARVEDNP